MAIAVNETKVIEVGQSEALVLGTVTFSGSYPTGGEDITGAVPGANDYDTFVGNAPGWALTYDQTNKKIQAWGSNGAAPAALAEHAAAAFAVTGFFVATRPM